MKTTITKELVRKASDEIVEAISKIGEKYGVQFRAAGGSYSPDELTIRIKGVLVDGNGNKTCENHSLNNSLAESYGVQFVGNIIGSIWEYRDNYYTIEEVLTRGKYHFVAKKYGMEGKRTRMSKSCLQNQMIAPTIEHFRMWFTADEITKLKGKQAEIFESVTTYLSVYLGEDNTNKFFNIVDTLNERDNAEDFVLQAYEDVIQDNNLKKFLLHSPKNTKK